MPGWSSALAVAVAAILVLGLPQPPGARAVPVPPPELAIFAVPASHGYEVMVFASATLDGTGTVSVFAVNPSSAAIYRTSATVTDSTVEADLGELGRISVKSVRTGRKRIVPDSCDREKKRRTGAPEPSSEEGAARSA